MAVTASSALRTAAQPSTLWRVLTDRSHWPEALPDIAEAQVVPDGPLVQGSVITTARQQPGRTLRRYTFVVEELVPERRLVLHGRGRGHRSIVTYDIEPSESGSLICTTMMIDSANPFASVLISLFGGLYRRHMGPLVEARSGALARRAEQLDAQAA